MFIAVSRYNFNEKQDVLEPLSKAIIKTLLYFRIFRIPLSIDEIRYYCTKVHASRKEIIRCLNNLIDAEYVNEKNSFYYISGDNFDSVIERKKDGAARSG